MEADFRPLLLVAFSTFPGAAPSLPISFPIRLLLVLPGGGKCKIGNGADGGIKYVNVLKKKAFFPPKK